jgi:site-specific DNA recombinase
MRKMRCAIYTRKSSEEGLDQSFNSLDAQRESCEAYARSQQGEGWRPLPDHYDDGGWSGGTIERPALQRLLADVETGRVDIIIVYKVDRLTRSLSDFARMVELFDRHAVSFVSVTQAFNTTTSMGRLTLNVLLSFAQFEREVTGERIRDKVAASKAKGMWMGGYPPLGYDPDGRTLAVNEPEAEKVRLIFERYLELKSVNAIARALDLEGIRSKAWTSSTGKVRGGVPFSRGALHHMLRNRLYIGEIVHKDKSHPGQHSGVIDPDLFEKVQQQLASRAYLRKRRKVQRAPLTGLLFDAIGNRMSPAHTIGRANRRYRYYVSAPLQAGGTPVADVLQRVPADSIEQLVMDRLRSWADDPYAGWEKLRQYVRRVEATHHCLAIEIAPPAGEDWQARFGPAEQVLEAAASRLRVTFPAVLCLRGGRTWVAHGSSESRARRIDRTLARGLRRAHAELRKRGIDLLTHPQFAQAKGVQDPYLRSLSTLAFLAPDIQRAILEGSHPPGLTLQGLLDQRLPVSWSEQRQLLGF